MEGDREERIGGNMHVSVNYPTETQCLAHPHARSSVFEPNIFEVHLH